MIPNGIRQLLRSWFELTSHEQTAVILILALFLLGVLARWVHVLS